MTDLVSTTQGPPFAQTAATRAVINLGLGQPSPSLLPLAALAQAAGRSLRGDGDPLLMQYGTMRGTPGALDALARFLSAEYRYDVRAEELMITAGNSTAIALAAQVFAEPKATVVCEDPTYFLAHGILASHGLDIVGVATDERGLRVDRLESWLAGEGSGGPRELALVYCIPNFQNPTGVCLSPERGAALVDLAERHDFVILADEPYGMLHHGDTPPPCMVQHDRGRGRVLSLGSFSKILGPGLRLGWAHGHPDLIARLCSHGSIRSGGGLNPVVSAMVQDTLDSGFLTEHVAQLRAVFGRRAAALTAAVRRWLPRARFLSPTGGYFMWVDVSAYQEQGPGGEAGDSAGRTEALRREGVGATAGSRCAVDLDLRHCLRLCFAFYDEAELEEGVRRLARALGAG